MPRARTASDPVVTKIVVSTVKTFAQTLRRTALSKRLLEMDVRAEQQAFAKFDLDYVMDEYLPAKLRHPAKFLP